MNKKQLLVLIPIFIALIGLIYYGASKQPQTASIGELQNKTTTEDSETIVYEIVPTDGAPIMFQTLNN